MLARSHFHSLKQVRMWRKCLNLTGHSVYAVTEVSVCRSVLDSLSEARFPVLRESVARTDKGAFSAENGAPEPPPARCALRLPRSPAQHLPGKLRLVPRCSWLTRLGGWRTGDKYPACSLLRLPHAGTRRV